jgi:uncharacterized membrane protein YhaH (DUF805 family)
MARFTPLSPSGRLAPLPFIVAASVVYVVSFGSQMLLSPQVTARTGVWAFALVQAVLIWAWYVLHARRLRDAGRPGGLAAGIAVVYALEVVLIVAIVALLSSSGMPHAGGAREEASILNLFVLLYLLTVLAGDSGFDALWWWFMGFLVVLLLPIVIALGFSLWAATRPSGRSA